MQSGPLVANTLQVADTDSKADWFMLNKGLEIGKSL